MASIIRDRLKRVAAMAVACMTLVISFPSVPAYASSTTASTAENVSTSLSAVTEALSEYVGHVVGVNANDKHSDNAESNVAHQIVELGNDYSNIGNAGGAVGYVGDGTSWYGDIDTKAGTVYDYSAFAGTVTGDTVTGLGDNGNMYAYARYGRLLTELGLDKTGNAASGNIGRQIGGTALQGIYLFAAFVPTAFDLALNIMDLLNPFRFLIDENAVEGVITSSTWDGTATAVAYRDPFDDTPYDVSVEFGEVVSNVAEEMPELTNDIYGAGAFGTLMRSITGITTQIYVICRNVGMVIILPVMLAFVLFTWLMMRSFRNFGARVGVFTHIFRFLIRFVFIMIGVPLMGIAYTSFLDSAEVNVSSNAPSSRIVACSFIDFENWVKASRLDPPPATASATTVLYSEPSDSSESAGTPGSETWRTLRETAYQINRNLGYGLPEDSGLGLYVGSSAASDLAESVSETDGTNYYASWAAAGNAGMWNSDGTWTEFGEEDTDGSGSDGTLSSGNQMFAKLNSLIRAYANGSYYTAAAWASTVNSTLSMNYRQYLGSAASSGTSSMNKQTIYQMYMDTDDVSDWENREIIDNGRIFKGIAAGDDMAEAAWSGMPFNIFSNGSNFGGLNTKDFTSESTIAYAHDSSVEWGSAADPKYKGGLSTAAMYNYLSSKFGESEITVYSAENTTSEYTRESHYSANIVGSGIVGWLFAANCFIVLGIYVILGFVFCFQMMWNALKYGFKMLSRLPGALFGVFSMIIQAVIYLVFMIVEILIGMCLYSIAAQMVMVFASLLEGPIINAVGNVINATIGGIPALMAGGTSVTAELAVSNFSFFAGFGILTFLLALFGGGLIAVNRVFVTASCLISLKLMRILTFKDFCPVFDDAVADSGSMYPLDGLLDGLDGFMEGFDAPDGGIFAERSVC